MNFKRDSKDKSEGRLRQIRETLKTPASLIPDCFDKGFFCPFASYEKKLSGSVDLGKFSKSHDEFLRGLSETSRAMDVDNPKFSFLAKTPHGSVTYLRKGDTDQFVLAGIQNSKNDIFRMLAFSRLVASGKAIIYSAGEYYRATCKNSPPERKFLENVMKEEGISFSVSEDGLIRIGNDEENFTMFIMGIPSLLIGSQSKVSTPVRIIKYMLARNPPDLFSYDLPLLEQFKDKGEMQIFGEYLLGNHSDSDFFAQIMKRRTASAKNSGSFLIGKEHYSSIENFIEKIDIPKIQKDLIIKLWPNREGIFIEDPSPRKFFETIWPEIGDDFLKALFPNVSGELIKKMRGNPLDIIARMEKEVNLESTRKSMNLGSWSDASEELAQLIAIGKTEGKDSLEEYISKMPMKESDSQAVAYCIQDIFGLNKNQSWKISSDAEVKGRLIIPIVKEIMNSEGDQQSAKFREISKIIR